MYTLEEINAANILINIYHNRHDNCNNHVHIGVIENKIYSPKEKTHKMKLRSYNRKTST